MNCKKNNNEGCGCGGYVNTIIDQNTECNEEPCSEIFSTECVLHTGEEMSNGIITVSKGDRIGDVLQRILGYMRDQSLDIPVVRIYDITEDSALISIKYDSNYTIKYKENGTEQWTEVSSSADKYLLQNLSSNTTYDLVVSGLSDSLTFKFSTK